MTKNNIKPEGALEVKTYWDTQYSENKLNWDVGYPTTPIKEYIDQLSDKSLKILVPGAGNSYEAEYLYANGFMNVFVLDISSVALNIFKKRYPGFPDKQILNQDYFEHTGTYDIIIEQTFFCAIKPEERKKYVEKTHSLLKEKGKLVGLLFNHEFEKEGPPYGGSIEEYEDLFIPYFEMKTFEVAYNSIKPRNKREHFINFVKK